MNDLTILIPNKNKKDQLYELFNMLPRNVHIIVCDLNSNDGVDYSHLPSNSIVISKAISENALINDALLNHVKTPYVMVLDMNPNISLNDIRLAYNNKNSNIIKVVKNNLFFHMNIGEKLGFFVESHPLYKEIFTQYAHHKGVKVQGAFSALTQQKKNEIEDIIKNINNIHNSRNFSIIFPTESNDILLSQIKEQINENDELVTFKSGNSTLAKKVDAAIKNSKYDNILIINPYISKLENIILRFRKNFTSNAFLITHTQKKQTQVNGIVNIINPTSHSSIGFDKKLYNGFDILNNLLLEDIIRKIIQKNDNITCKSIHYSGITQDLRTEHLKKKTKKEKNKKLQNEDPHILEIHIKGRKPKILLLTDVKGWAWDYKSHKLMNHLSDEFDFNIHSVLSEGYDIPTGFDIYMSYGYSYVDCMKNIPKRRRISGITAHRPIGRLAKSMKNVFAAHANSIMLLDELKTIHNNTYYVPNGVDEKQFIVKKKIPKKRKELVVGHVGKLCKEKGQKEFIEPACKLAGVKYIPHYNNYMNAIPHDKMPDFYTDIDVFIVASTEDGTPNGALESAACGRPILSNKIGNMPEFIINGYNGFIVDKNINAYVEMLEYLKNNRELLIEMGENARTTVEEGWTWDIMSKNYSKMFWDMVDVYEK